MGKVATLAPATLERRLNESIDRENDLRAALEQFLHDLDKALERLRVAVKMPANGEDE